MESNYSKCGALLPDSNAICENCNSTKANITVTVEDNSRQLYNAGQQFRFLLADLFYSFLSSLLVYLNYQVYLGIIKSKNEYTEMKEMLSERNENLYDISKFTGWIITTAFTLLFFHRISNAANIMMNPYEERATRSSRVFWIILAIFYLIVFWIAFNNFKEAPDPFQRMN